jgi:cell division protein FtsB
MAVRNNPFKPIIKMIPAPLRNIYFWSLALFFGWLIIFDKNDVLTQWKLQRTLSRLKQDKIYYQEKIEEVKQDKYDIEKDKEKFAREHYYMQKSDEDVFIIVDEEKKK